MTTFDVEVASKHRRETGLPKFRLLALKRFILYRRFPQADTDILDQPGLHGTLAHRGIISWTPRLGAHALVLVYMVICPLRALCVGPVVPLTKMEFIR